MKPFVRPPDDCERELRVMKARDYVATMKTCRMKIVALALEECVIGEASRARNFKAKELGISTLEKFADDIGVARNTLKAWINLKRIVVDRIGSAYDDESPDAFPTAIRTFNKLKAKKSTDPELIRKTFAEEGEKRKKKRVINRTGAFPLIAMITSVQARLKRVKPSPSEAKDLKKVREQLRALRQGVDLKIEECR